MMLLHSLLTFASLCSWASAQDPEQSGLESRAGKPNIVFTLTDDQDKHLNSMDYMQSVQKHLVQQGTTYEHHYCTVALCCPSRVNLLTGKAAHNTNVTTLRMPFGGYNKFANEHLNQQWIAPWMQNAGYKTYYRGKLMNDHTKDNYNTPFPAGLDGNDFLIGPEPPKKYSGYATDLLAEKSYAFLDEGAKSNKPFFLMIATVAPHASSDKGEDDDGHDGENPADNLDASSQSPATGEGNAPIPAERHKHLFPNAQVDRTPENFNPGTPSGASWVRNLKKQGPANLAYNDLYYRRRLQALQAVDDLVNGTVARLEKHGILDNTYIIYSTDNGYHIGQHRLQPGKSCPYEEDINIPLVIRGPNVPKNKISNLISSHTDLVPTILGWAGADLPRDLDGKAINTNGQQSFGQVWEHTQVEHWGDAGFDGKYEKGKHRNTTYKAVRVIGAGYNFYYSVWCNNEHELYDMEKDKGQMSNLYSKAGTTFSIANRQISLKQLEARLDTLLLVLKDCRGTTCIKPWSALHPQGGVESLKDALVQKFDGFYEQEQRKVSFDECTQGYIQEFEGPTGLKTYGAMA